MTIGDIWLAHYSVMRWNSASEWDDYLHSVERLLSDRLVKLDDTDPVRRKANMQAGEGSFITRFGEQEASRWIRGKFEKTKIEFEVQIYKLGVDSFGRERENSISFYIPEKAAPAVDDDRLVKLFDLTNETLRPFYAYADFKNVICSKKPSTPSLDLSRELLGIFWLTYFDANYCSFFGREKLTANTVAKLGAHNGISLRLASSSRQVSVDARLTLEAQIGPESFAGHGTEKARGQYALTLSQMSAFQGKLT